MSVHELLPLYVIDGLPDDERIAFDAHLGSCAVCQAELASYAPVLEALADEVVHPPEPGLRDRVLAQTSDAPQEAPITGAALSDAGDVAHVSVLRQGRPGVTASRWLAVAAAVLAFALIAATATGVGLWQRSNRLERQLVEQRGQIEQSAELAAVLSASDVKLIDVETDLSGNLRVAIADSMDSGVVIADGLQAPPDDRAYQLWLVSDGEPRSAGMVGRGQGSGVVGVLTQVTQAQAVAISVEPPSGSEAPTGPIVAEALLN